MDQEHARNLLRAERLTLERLLRELQVAAQCDRAAADEPAAVEDPAQALNVEQTDDSLAASVRERLAAVARAEERLELGVFGRSIRSGRLIPDDRLEVEPAAELTVEEAGEGS